MIYNNLLYLLVVILILSTATIPATPALPPPAALLLFAAKGLLYHLLVHRAHAGRRISQAPEYFAIEQRYSILAIASLAIDVYLLDSQYYLAKLPLASQLPVLAHLGGVALFFGYLAVLWGESRRSYEEIFARHYSTASFVLANIKVNLPIILPWLLLSLLSDLLQLADIPIVKDVLASSWGEPVIFLLFFLVLALIFPVLIVRLWNCTPLPAGSLRSAIEEFCRQEKLSYRDIMLWPLFEGRVLTAGVMGLTKRFRYLLLTPALLRTLTPMEVEAVLAHEIGHVKKHHLQLYILLFLGFTLLAQVVTYPAISLLLNSDLFYDTMLLTRREPSAMLTFASVVPLFVLMIVYFRYVFGFFMRNFERQADLHVFTALPSAQPLIHVLEKIAWLSGNIRDLPSWHHFGIGQRVEYLERSQQDPSLIRRHDRKVRAALALYLLAMAVSGLLLWKMPTDIFTDGTREKFTEAVLRQKIRQAPQNVFWHQLMGDLQQSRKHYREAIDSYEQALSLAPDNAMAKNNLAWLLLTAEEPRFLDPQRALVLATDAAHRKPEGFVLDTLATAYWANGLVEMAIRTEKQAIDRDPPNADYYRQRIGRFEGGPWLPGANPDS